MSQLCQQISRKANAVRLCLAFGSLHQPLISRESYHVEKVCRDCFNLISHRIEKGEGLKCLNHKAWQQMWRAKIENSLREQCRQ